MGGGSKGMAMPEGTRTLREMLLAARRAAGMTQSEVARKVGCQQSAISMFESGLQDRLSEEKILALAKVLKVDPAGARPEPVARTQARQILKYCPVDECPSNVPYVVRGQVCFAPVLVLAGAEERTHCSDCGEMLESACPNEACGAPVAPGAFCPVCGTRYVTPGGRATRNVEAWIAARREAIDQLRTMQSLRPVGGGARKAEPVAEDGEERR
ncbi:MAG: helix-turn-helix domain-containing protein [Lentisphaerae bacterium]|nr:helix-turn-helix domain-containing protein [Lentisphaerota bacterium]